LAFVGALAKAHVQAHLVLSQNSKRQLPMAPQPARKNDRIKSLIPGAGGHIFPEVAKITHSSFCSLGKSGGCVLR
jgi:hypothetical protein